MAASLLPERVGCVVAAVDVEGQIFRSTFGVIRSVWRVLACVQPPPRVRIHKHDRRKAIGGSRTCTSGHDRSIWEASLASFVLISLVRSTGRNRSSMYNRLFVASHLRRKVLGQIRPAPTVSEWMGHIRSEQRRNTQRLHSLHVEFWYLLCVFRFYPLNKIYY